MDLVFSKEVSMFKVEKDDYWEQLNKSIGKNISGKISNMQFDGEIEKIEGSIIYLTSGRCFDYMVLDSLYINIE